MHKWNEWQKNNKTKSQFSEKLKIIDKPLNY